MVKILKDKGLYKWVCGIFLYAMVIYLIAIVIRAADIYRNRPGNPNYTYYWQAVNYIDGTSDIADPQLREHIQEAARYSYRDAKVINECFEMIESFSQKEWCSYHDDKTWGFDFDLGEYKGDCAQFVNDATEYYISGVGRPGFFRDYRRAREQYYKEYYGKDKPKETTHITYYKRDKSGKLIFGFFDADKVDDPWVNSDYYRSNSYKSDSYTGHSYDGPFNDPSDYDDMDDYLDDAWGYDFDDWDDALDYWEDY